MSAVARYRGAGPGFLCASTATWSPAHRQPPGGPRRCGVHCPAGKPPMARQRTAGLGRVLRPAWWSDAGLEAFQFPAGAIAALWGLKAATGLLAAQWLGEPTQALYSPSPAPTANQQCLLAR